MYIHSWARAISSLLFIELETYITFVVSVPSLSSSCYANSIRDSHGADYFASDTIAIKTIFPTIRFACVNEEIS